MRAIYLIVDKGNQMAKVGYTTDLAKRVYQYTTANPKARVIDYCEVYTKTKTQLEHCARADLEALGGVRLTSPIDGKRTEWFDFEGKPEVFQELLHNGLTMLKSCKGRKCCGVFCK